MPDGVIDWNNVKRVLVVRMRSIGDTVLTTPSLIALHRFLPDAKIDILLEDWVAPVLDGFEDINKVISVGSGSLDRLKTASKLRKNRYDLVFNLHGGTTSTFLTYATSARYRIGYSHYQYRFLHNVLYSSAVDYWNSDQLHSVEQHLALLGHAGVPVDDKPKTRLTVTVGAIESLKQKLLSLSQHDIDGHPRYALIHPAAAYDTKQWATDKFARTAEYLAERGLETIAVAARSETSILDELAADARVPVTVLDNLTLPEITALVAGARLFVGNDSGIAHIAAAVGTPSVVVFGSSNRVHWRPWTGGPSEVVYEPFHCQPCAGNVCAEFGEPRCILNIPVGLVTAAIDRVLKKNGTSG